MQYVNATVEAHQRFSHPCRKAGCAIQVEGVAVITNLKGSVYIKYNAVSQQCYVTQYSGKDRGVLVTFGGTLVGHLPLGLFDESMQQESPLN